MHLHGAFLCPQGSLPAHLLAGPMVAAWAHSNPALAAQAHAHLQAQRAATTHALLLQQQQQQQQQRSGGSLRGSAAAAAAAGGMTVMYGHMAGDLHLNAGSPIRRQLHQRPGQLPLLQPPELLPPPPPPPPQSSVSVPTTPTYGDWQDSGFVGFARSGFDGPDAPPPPPHPHQQQQQQCATHAQVQAAAHAVAAMQQASMMPQDATAPHTSLDLQHLYMVMLGQQLQQQQRAAALPPAPPPMLGYNGAGGQEALSSEAAGKASQSLQPAAVGAAAGRERASAVSAIVAGAGRGGVPDMPAPAANGCAHAASDRSGAASPAPSWGSSVDGGAPRALSTDAGSGSVGGAARAAALQHSNSAPASRGSLSAAAAAAISGAGSGGGCRAQHDALAVADEHLQEHGRSGELAVRPSAPSSSSLPPGLCRTSQGRRSGSRQGADEEDEEAVTAPVRPTWYTAALAGVRSSGSRRASEEGRATVSQQNPAGEAEGDGQEQAVRDEGQGAAATAAAAAGAPAGLASKDHSTAASVPGALEREGGGRGVGGGGFV